MTTPATSTEPLSISTGPANGGSGERQARLTPKSSFSYSHSPQDSSTPVGSGGLVAQFQHRNSSNTILSGNLSGAVSPMAGSTNPVVVTPSGGPTNSSFSTPAGGGTSNMGAVGGIGMTTPTSSKVAGKKCSIFGTFSWSL